MKQFHRYLPLNDETLREDLYVLAGGFALIPPLTPYPPTPHPTDHDFRWTQGRTLDEHQLIYITRGSGVFESKTGGVRPIRPGSLFMLFPGEWHRYAPDHGTGWDEYWVAFQGEASGRLASGYPFSPSEPVLYASVDETLLEEFVRIADEMRAEAIGYQRVIAARTRLIFALAVAASERAQYQGTDRLRTIEQAKCRLLEQIDQPVNVELLAVDLGVGYSAFRRMFREYTGLSPAQYHLQLRLHAARDLLRTTTIPIAVIGQRVGFGSAYYFARIFREKTGLTPSAYRAESHTPAPREAINLRTLEGSE